MSYEIDNKLMGAVALRESAASPADFVTARARELALRVQLEERDFSAAERKGLAKKGHALPDGSYPIVTKDHVKDAVKAVGRAPEGKRKKVRQHIVKRARALGALSLVPSSWDESPSEEASETPEQEAQEAAVLTEAAISELETIELSEAVQGLTASDFAFLREAADSMAKASSPEPFSKSKTSNWVARGGGLPPYAQHIAHDLMEKRGKSESEAIALAIGIIKRWARGGGKVDDNTRAAARKALAQWEKLKAGAHAKK